MSEENTKKPLTLNRGTLGLKKPLSLNQVHSSNASSKFVRVEVRKKRTGASTGSANVMSDEAQAQKLKLLMQAKKVEEQKAQAKAEQEALREKERQEQEAIKATEQERLQKGETEYITKEPTLNENKKVVSFGDKSPKDKKKYARTEEGDDEENALARNHKKADDKTIMMPKRKVGGDERRKNAKFNLSTYMGDDSDDDEGWGQKRGRSLASIKRAREKERLKHQEVLKTAEKISRQVTIPETITVQELANRMAERAATVVKTLMNLGVMATITQTIDADTAELVAEELGHKVIRVAESDVENILHMEEDKPEDMQSRPPVVTVMGHVDHGKTSLLDALRSTNVVAGEAGGITQHIGAYQVTLANGQKVTFIDTPGHAAFTAMRARGAKITDIVILVVAANDGIMPQTVEAINHAKAAGVEIIVAINKMDKEGANPDKVMQQLTEHELVPEEWGGDVICVPVSAKTKMGIDKLLETILLVSEMAELKANPDRQAKGVVIEAKLDKGRGPIATLLVQNGTLNAGDIVVAGTAVGKIRAMSDYHGKPIETAGPSVPVEIMGLDSAPMSGDEFNAVSDEKLARALVEQRKAKAKEEEFKLFQKVTLDTLFDTISEGEMKELNIIVKADVQGSVEAVKQSLLKIENDEVNVKIVHGAVGAVSESDVMLAEASKAIIVAFNTGVDQIAADNAKRDGVEIKQYDIIYDAIEDIERAMRGMRAPKYRDVDTGEVEVREVYKISSAGTIAGSLVTSGTIKRDGKVRVIRNGKQIADVKLANLKRFKDEVKEVSSGYECGISLDGWDDIQSGDILQAYIVEEYRD